MSNELSKSLRDLSDNELDFYLEITPTPQVRKDVEELIQEAALSTPAGKLKADVLKVLKQHED